jgi:hypothetical protein
MKCFAFVLTCLLLVAYALPARADLKTQAIREAAEAALARFGTRAVTREATEVLASRMASSAAKHGDEVIAAVRQVGPRALRLVEDAAASNPQMGSQAARLLATHGEPAVAWVLSRAQGMAQFARFGEDAAAVLMKHKSIAEPLIEKGGAPAVAALKNLAPQSGRRLAIMAQEGGAIAEVSQSPEMLSVLAKYGDGACDFLGLSQERSSLSGHLDPQMAAQALQHNCLLSRRLLPASCPG